MLDPDAVVRIDAAARIDAPPSEVGKPRELRGARAWASRLFALSRGLRSAELALVDGSVGLVLAPRGKLARALTFGFANARITRLEVIADPARLRALDVAVV